MDLDSILENRSIQCVLGILGSNLYGLGRKNLSILDVSYEDSPIAKALVYSGYIVDRNSMENRKGVHYDVILFDGSNGSVIQSKDLLDVFKPGTQLVVTSTPVSWANHHLDGDLNPYDFGDFRLFPITRWYDFVFGFGTKLDLARRPVVKFKARY
jgi:hypothetical protein